MGHRKIKAEYVAFAIMFVLILIAILGCGNKTIESKTNWDSVTVTTNNDIVYVHNTSGKKLGISEDSLVFYVRIQDSTDSCIIRERWEYYRSKDTYRITDVIITNLKEDSIIEEEHEIKKEYYLMPETVAYKIINFKKED